MVNRPSSGAIRAASHRRIAPDRSASDNAVLISILAKLLGTTGLLRFAASAKRTTVVGNIDGIHRGQIRGWAIDLAEPNSRLIIQVVDESDKVIVELLADRYRADVQKAGYGDGHHGFAMPAVSPRAMEKKRFLCGKPLTELSQPDLVSGNPGTRLFERADYVLCVDQIPATAHLTGWALDRSHPEERRTLRLRSGRQTLAERRATLFRCDSLERGSDGFHGFSLPLSSSTDHLFVEDLASGLEFRIS
ncbi:MAG: glycosyl transferase family 2 [Bradyrhizobium sp.]|nr:glycosyl transferase family 2 [Bradyrhizobium sp.]